MPVKRKSRGRSKGSKGRTEYVQCSMCGRLVPADKAKKVTRKRPLVDPSLARELSDKGAWVGYRVETRYYCISCAVYHGIVKIRSEEERKVKPVRRKPRRRFLRPGGRKPPVALPLGV
ncbi:30S ribosomal protein S26e [Candidatus Bathyarchaeota archaeon]|mgnify:CR=1 FL=1|nr:MAG: 30S ribosomal protein S26e [Candidatus Bathyarchaeota archaeon]